MGDRGQGKREKGKGKKFKGQGTRDKGQGPLAFVLDLPLSLFPFSLDEALRTRTRAPSWISRDGRRVLLIRPNCEFPNDVFGFEKCAWLNTLNVSMRSSIDRAPPSDVRLNSEKSVLSSVGPRTWPIS